MSDDQSIKVPAAIDATAPHPADFTVLARNPTEMATAQQEMIAWASQKVAAEQADLADCMDNLAQAKKAKWKTAPWQSRVRKAQQRVAFYEKTRGALEAGYYIVPPFDVDVFAVRVNRPLPSQEMLTTHGGWIPPTIEQNAEMLPAGAGRYVSPDAPTDHGNEIKYKTSDNRDVTKRHYWATDFAEVDFPFKLAKPAILHATYAAMALKVFDRIGCLPRHRAPDPIICGQILMPHRSKAPLTFFVAWWLDTNTL